MASQITGGVSSVCSTDRPGSDQRKHQNSAALALGGGGGGGGDPPVTGVYLPTKGQ